MARAFGRRRISKSDYTGKAAWEEAAEHVAKFAELLGVVSRQHKEKSEMVLKLKTVLQPVNLI